MEPLEQRMLLSALDVIAAVPAPLPMATVELPTGPFVFKTTTWDSGTDYGPLGAGLFQTSDSTLPDPTVPSTPGGPVGGPGAQTDGAGTVVEDTWGVLRIETIHIGNVSPTDPFTITAGPQVWNHGDDGKELIGVFWGESDIKVVNFLDPGGTGAVIQLIEGVDLKFAIWEQDVGHFVDPTAGSRGSADRLGPHSYVGVGDHASSILWASGESEAGFIGTLPQTEFKSIFSSDVSATFPGNASAYFSIRNLDLNGNGVIDADEVGAQNAVADQDYFTNGLLNPADVFLNMATNLNNPTNAPGGFDWTITNNDDVIGSVGEEREPGIDIEKATNGQDADSPTGPVIPVGDTATFTYVVTNTGNVPLANVVVTDDNGTPGVPGDDFHPVFTDGDANDDGLLDLDEAWTYEASRVVTPGQYANVSTVAGEDSVTGEPVDDQDPSHHFGEEVKQPCRVIIIDEDGLDNDFHTVEQAAAGHGVEPDFLINDDKPTEIGNPPLRWNELFPGDIVKLPTGQVDDEGWFALPENPVGQYGPFTLEDFVAGVVPQDKLDKVDDVMPLRNQEIAETVGQCFVAVVYDSDISMNYEPLQANLQGARYGLFYFTVLAVETAGPEPDSVGPPNSLPESRSDTSLYDVWIRVDEVCDNPLLGFEVDVRDHEPNSIEIDKASQEADGTLTVHVSADKFSGGAAERADDGIAYVTVTVDGADQGGSPGVDPVLLEVPMTYDAGQNRYEFSMALPENVAGRRINVQDDEGGVYAALITGPGLQMTATGAEPAASESAASEPAGGEGLLAGFWKRAKHFDCWVGYDRSDSFDAVFGVDARGDRTLLEALRVRGGGESALMRHAVAALLNAANPDVDYAYTEAEVIEIVQDAYSSGDFKAAKGLLAAENRLGCDLDGGA
jgi:hypothetical protein